MGPSALRIAHIRAALERVGYEVNDRGDIDVTIPESLSAGDPGAKYLPLVSEVCGRVADETGRILEEGGLPLVVGGDHSIAIGTISGLSASLSARDPGRSPGAGLGVLWFDAHADINTPETSPSGNIHGMAVACLLGSGPDELVDLAHPGPKLSPERIVQVGLRDVDTVEKRLLRLARVDLVQQQSMFSIELPPEPIDVRVVVVHLQGVPTILIPEELAELLSDGVQYLDHAQISYALLPNQEDLN